MLMILFILANPSSGNGQTKMVIEKIKKDYPEIAVRVFMTKYAGDEPNQVSQVLTEYNTGDRLLILGGDGSLSKLLKELPPHIPFAYYPTGSGNDFARSIAIKRIDEIMEALISDEKQPITLLTYKDGVVVNSLDFGFVARVTAYSENSWLKNHLKKLGLGQLSYIVYAVKTLFTNQAVQLLVTNETKALTLSNLFFITFANNRYFGGGIMIWPTSSIFTRAFDVVYIERKGLLHNTLSLLDLLFKRHLSSPRIQHFSAEKLKIKVIKTDFSQVDGEVINLEETILEGQERYMYLSKE